jgi:membrane associated rhomboid family serine protease
MALRQTTGSVVCPSCRSLVGVNDPTCYNCGRRNPGLWGFAPLFRSLGDDLGFGQIIMGSCGVLYVLSLLLSGGEIGQNGPMNFLAPSHAALFLLGESGAVPIFGYGRWWTVLSAGWLHGGLLHIVMNLLWVRQLAPVVADVYGPGRAIILYTVSSVAGFALSSLAFFNPVPIPLLQGAGFTVGASAPIFGLLGALVCYGRMGGSSMINTQAKSYALMLFLFGLVIPGVDNFAHAGGFIGGYLVARWMNPFKPERLDHLLWAIGCLAATLIAIVASVVLGLPYLRG